MTRSARFIAHFLFAFAAAFLLQSCSTRSATTPGASSQDLNAALASGELRLKCGTRCVGSWGSARAKAKGLHDQRLWTDLAAEVGRVGYETDLTYYYLARAAEGLGHAQAAATYYKLSLAQPVKCAAILNNCDGFDVPRDATAGLDRLMK